MQIDRGRAILVDCLGARNGEIIAVVDAPAKCPIETTWFGRTPGSDLFARVRTA